MVNATLPDDAFHPSILQGHLETWYFDAVFTNFSTAIEFTVIQGIHHGIMLTGLYLYRNGELIHTKRSLSTLSHVQLSQDHPEIHAENTSLVGNTTESDAWAYDLAVSNDGQGVDLHFESTMPAWKTRVRGGWWLALPDLHVTGRLTIDGVQIIVDGQGYHDHNWFSFLTPLLQKGWQFINIAGDRAGITLAKIQTTRLRGTYIIVLNQPHTTPMLLDPSTIQFKVTDWMPSFHRQIPRNFTLQLTTDRVQLAVTLTTEAVHSITFPFTLYWRYHLRILGTLTVDGQTQVIDMVRISELVRFL